MSHALRLGQIAERFGLELRGDPERAVDGVATLASAGPERESTVMVALSNCRRASDISQWTNPSHAAPQVPRVEALLSA